MPRQITWLPRLKKLQDRVDADSRTAFTTADVGDLFGLKAAAARELVSLMPRSLQANNPIVAREDLYAWLGQCIDAEDLSAHLVELRKNPPAPSRKKYRIQVPRLVEADKIGELRKHGIWFETNGLTIDFTTQPDFFRKIFLMLEAIQAPDFERRYCTPLPISERAPREAALEHDVAWFKAERTFISSIAKGVDSSGRGDRKRTNELHTQACEAFAEMQRICAENGDELDEVYIRAHAAICDEAAAD